MILRVGFQTFEFQQGREIRFGSMEDALNWLKHLGFPDSDLILRLREYVARYSGNLESSRLTDHQVLERMAVLLYSRRVVVIGREQRTASPPSQGASTAPTAPAFPLSERSGRASTASSPPLAGDSPTFDPGLAAAQAAALAAAAAAGSPFCQECK